MKTLTTPENLNRTGAQDTSTRPMTGAEYIESLRDGREIYIYGDRVKDVTTHPAFRNSVRMTARLYDALHDPKNRDVLTCPTDTGSGGYTRHAAGPIAIRVDILAENEPLRKRRFASPPAASVILKITWRTFREPARFSLLPPWEPINSF